MTTEVFTVVISIVKFILDRVAASDATKAAFEKLVEASINDGLISKDSHKVFVNQYHDVEDQLNASPNTAAPAPASKS